VRLREELQARLRELESARLRLVAAGDRQREQAAADVRAAVDAPLRLAGHEVDLARHALVGPGADALAVVSAELGAASRELQELVQGTPAVRLGNGGLGAALETLVAVRGGVVELRVEEGAVADRLLETTLFYVCSEALANATKHANATRVSLLVRRVGQRLEVVVRDDGTGGADPTGSGLQGLVDRLETVRGQLQVTSPPGAGTEVRATVPLS
jgi:signal transduction histidine kinase